MSLITALFAALAIFGIYYVAVFYRGMRAAQADGEVVKPTPLGLLTARTGRFRAS